MDRAEAWWHRQVIDRPPVTMHVRPERAPRKVPAHHASLRERWLDVEYAVACAEASVESGVFLAENFPRYMPNLGPEICAALYGAELEFTENTSWSVPCLGDLRELLDRQPDLDNAYWATIRQMTELSVQRGAGRWITAVTDLHTNGDLLAALRDPQRLALDYADDYEAVQLTCRHVTPHFRIMFDDLYGRLGPDSPCATWGAALARGTMYYTSCDFVCMISPRMFAETILPALDWETRHVDHSIYHLDGPGARVHLDAILAMEALDAVQWVYGAGAGRAADWIDVYRRVQAAGKGIEVLAVDLHDARTVLEHLNPEGLWLYVGGGYSRDEAESFLADLRRWAAGRR